MMVAAGLEPFLKGDSGRNTRGLLRIIILCTIAAAAIASRLFSVIRKLPKSQRQSLVRDVQIIYAWSVRYLRVHYS